VTYRGHIKNGVAVLDESIDLPDGTLVVIQPASTFGFHENLSLEQLAARQQIQPISSTADLQGDWPSEDSVDEFLAYVREVRR
jgi:hypothetical protein